LGGGTQREASAQLPSRFVLSSYREASSDVVNTSLLITNGRFLSPSNVLKKPNRQRRYADTDTTYGRGGRRTGCEGGGQVGWRAHGHGRSMGSVQTVPLVPTTSEFSRFGSLHLSLAERLSVLLNRRTSRLCPLSTPPHRPFHHQLKISLRQKKKSSKSSKSPRRSKSSKRSSKSTTNPWRPGSSARPPKRLSGSTHRTPLQGPTSRALRTTSSTCSNSCFTG
jgi:hypothetical protein